MQFSSIDELVGGVDNLIRALHLSSNTIKQKLPHNARIEEVVSSFDGDRAKPFIDYLVHFKNHIAGLKLTVIKLSVPNPADDANDVELTEAEHDLLTEKWRQVEVQVERFIDSLHRLSELTVSGASLLARVSKEEHNIAKLKEPLRKAIADALASCPDKAARTVVYKQELQQDRLQHLRQKENSLHEARECELRGRLTQQISATKESVAQLRVRLDGLTALDDDKATKLQIITLEGQLQDVASRCDAGQEATAKLQEELGQIKGNVESLAEQVALIERMANEIQILQRDSKSHTDTIAELLAKVSAAGEHSEEQTRAIEALETRNEAQAEEIHKLTETQAGLVSQQRVILGRLAELTALLATQRVVSSSDAAGPALTFPLFTRHMVSGLPLPMGSFVQGAAPPSSGGPPSGRKKAGPP